MGVADLLHLLHRDAGVFLAEMEHHRAGRRLVAAFMDVAAVVADGGRQIVPAGGQPGDRRSEEHTSELQSLMRISYAVFCLKKKKIHTLDTLHFIQSTTILTAHSRHRQRKLPPPN